MGKIDYHGVLDGLGAACLRCHSDIVFMVNPLQGFVFHGLKQGGCISRLLWQVGVFLRHVSLVGRIWSCRHRYILVREFSNVPLLIVAIFLFPFRKKLIFTMNHNLQWGVRSGIEGFALRWIDRFGFLFMFFETKELDGVASLGLSKDRHWVIPLPVEVTTDHFTHQRKFKVGLVGHYRSEKGLDEVLDVLLEKKLPFHWVVGMPNVEDFKNSSKHGGVNTPFELLDTSSPESYFSVLSSCDLIVLCYTPEGYTFRPSGLVADAAACGTAVLVPAYPVLKHQIDQPYSIGECYSSIAEIPECIERISERLEDFKRNFPSYAQGRNAETLAKLFDEQIAGMNS